MTHNKNEVHTEELVEFLRNISQFVEKPISLYVLGGTALTILKIKKSTLDIDINVQNETEFKYIINIFEKIGFNKLSPFRWQSQEGFIFDIFHSQQILGTHLLSDALQISKLFQKIGTISLFTLNLKDIIISKIARSDTRDIDDILTILGHRNINLYSLTQRYKKTATHSVISFAKQKYIDFLKTLEKNKITVPKEIQTEVLQWNL